MPPIDVSVVYAGENDVVRVDLVLPDGACLGDALAASGLVERYALGDVTGRTGVYGRLRGNDEPLQQGDRVEIYRPLRADPKVSRRQRTKRRPR